MGAGCPSKKDLKKFKDGKFPAKGFWKKQITHSQELQYQATVGFSSTTAKASAQSTGAEITQGLEVGLKLGSDLLFGSISGKSKTTAKISHQIENMVTDTIG